MYSTFQPKCFYFLMGILHLIQFPEAKLCDKCSFRRLSLDLLDLQAVSGATVDGEMAGRHSTLLRAARYFQVWKQMAVLTLVAHHQRAELD